MRRMNMHYWISDKDETPQRFPLQRLIRRIRDVVAPGAVTCEVLRVWGYGLQINEWDEALRDKEKITVPYELLDALSAGTEEWCYDIKLQFPGTDVRFGLHDSAALFVEADPSVADQI